MTPSNDTPGLIPPDDLTPYIAMDSPGIILVGISNDKKAIALKDIGPMLNRYINKFPAMIQARPDLQVGLCVYDPDQMQWVPLTKDMLDAFS